MLLETVMEIFKTAFCKKKNCNSATVKHQP